MSILSTPKRPVPDGSAIAFAIVGFGLLLTAFLRLWFFQVVRGPDLADQAQHINQATVNLLAPRGLIFDRDGHLLAGIKAEVVISAIPEVVKANPEVLTKLASILNVPVSRLQAKIKSSVAPQNLPVPIDVGADLHMATRIAESRNELPGIQVASQPMRYYPNTTDFTHILGYVWVPDKSDIKRLKRKGITPSEYVGKFGVEWKYEQELMGQPGSEVMDLGKKGIPSRIDSISNPVPGDQLTLSISSKLQEVANQDLKGRRGAVVALVPSTGEVLCMVSAPTYDLAQFEGGISTANYEALAKDPSKPFENRAVNGFYPPGSVFKLITSMAMEKSGHFDTSTTVFCDGGYHIGKAIVRCEGHHGDISYLRAFAVSCNTYFCTMGVRSGSEEIHKMGVEAGLAQKSGIDLRSELNSGFVPDRDNAYEVRKSGQWFTGDTANESIGQGYVLVSPLQMADVTALVANRGVSYVPHLVHSIKPIAGPEQVIQPKIFKQINMPDSFWSTLWEAMEGVISHGTATKAQIPGITWAGKTGSAQHGPGKPTDSWFVGFGPVENPKIAIAVIVESGGGGGDTAAPIARDVVKAYLEPQSSATNPTPSAKVQTKGNGKKVTKAKAPATSPLHGV